MWSGCVYYPQEAPSLHEIYDGARARFGADVTVEPAIVDGQFAFIARAPEREPVAA